MKGYVVVLFGALTCFASAASAQSLADQLAWAYAITTGPAPPAPPDDGTRYSLDGSRGRLRSLSRSCGQFRITPIEVVDAQKWDRRPRPLQIAREMLVRAASYT